ncbi:MAG: RidA family protein [Rhodothermales bacterium]|nr:RidA family protein [Rhodothermales bacterium]MBO6781477.1 RidA family protein [Rhodothermales bacterium]
MTPIQPDNAPAPKGHYSPGMVHQGVLYISGQLPTHPETGDIPAGIEAQTQLALEKVEAVVNAAGSSLDRVLQMRIYISNGDDWGAVNGVYAKYFGDHRPARCVVPTRDLHYGCLIEIEGTAAV